MAAIRSAETIARKWASVTPQRAVDYEAGIRDPRRDWKEATLAAEGAWATGVQEAVVKKRFGKGVTRAGTDAWQKGALEKGLQRWGPGVALAQDKYRVNFEPYQQAIARVNLPPRFARRDPRNLERVKAIVQALVAVKDAQGG